MTYELKDGQGSLFRNDRKQSSNHPDYRGDLRVEGIEFKLSGWVRETKDGRKYLSISAMPKEQRRPTPARDDSYGDEIPF